MTVFQTIVCAVDFSSGSRHALVFGAALAAARHGHAIALHVAPGPEGDTDRAGEALERLRAFVDRSELRADVEVRCVTGPVVPQLVRTSRALGADTIAIAPRAESPPERLPLGSTTQALLASAECPVLVVSAYAGRPRTEISHVLCPVDLSPGASVITSLAAGIAAAFGARMTVIHVIQWGEETPAARADPRAAADLEARTRDRLARVVTPGATPVRIDYVVEEGVAAREILFTARSVHADLIVMGAQSRGGWELLRLGSTTHDVTCEAPCPVLVIPGRLIQPQRGGQART